MRFISWLFSSLVLLILIGIGGGFWILHNYSKNLPDFEVLKDYEPSILSRVYAGDGRLLATFASEQRIFVPIATIPQRVKDAFLSAEDKDFYSHPGVDIFGIGRAVLANVQNMGSKRPMGASTITQQVAKNMLLTSEVSVERKIKEALLAFRIENVLTKDRILEIYLNQIFLGAHAYGVAAAALNYFNKSLDELTLGETAYLAGLPKAPNNYHPTKNAAEAIRRRNYVIDRMLENSKITREEAEAAKAETLQVRMRDASENVRAEYYAEEVRRELTEAYGSESVMQDGYAVRTSVDPKLQALADTALRRGLINYDQNKTGYRGPVQHLSSLNNWLKQLNEIEAPPGGEDWKLAVVLGIKDQEAELGLEGNARGALPFAQMRWARKELTPKHYGPAPKRAADVLNVGDVILVDAPEKSDTAEKPSKKKGAEAQGAKASSLPTYRLMQVPKIQGAFVALDPHTGRVLALVGGFSERLSPFNRATQAYRQTGSSFKPFVYLAALDNGFTPASLINDAPAEFSQGPGLPLWRPENFDGDYLGPITMRRALEKSRNIVTVRLALAIGMPKIVEYAKKFGIADDMPPYPSFALGAKETTLLRLATAYAMLANGGKKILPSFIDRIQDADGKTIWQHDRRPCAGCKNIAWMDKANVPELPDTREQVNDPRTVYQIVSLMEGVATRGTAAAVRTLHRTIAGKTGTTNESKDLWFVGFSANLAAGVFIGYDDPQPLGERETGGSVAVPIFKDFMEGALEGKPDIPFRVPPGVQMVKIDAFTGKRTTDPMAETIWEPFLPGTDPESSQTKILGGEDPVPPGDENIAPTTNGPPGSEQNLYGNNPLQPNQANPAPITPYGQPQPYPYPQQGQPYIPQPQTAPQPMPAPARPPAGGDIGAGGLY